MGESEVEKSPDAERSSFLARFGLTVEEGYQVSLDVYRRERDGAKFSYGDKIQLSALWRQCTHGPFSPDKFGDVGFFDFVGNDRRKAWQALGDLDTDSTRQSFIKLLAEACQEEMDNVAEKVQEAKRRASEELTRKTSEEAERRKREEAAARAQEEADRRAREEAERRTREEQERQRQHDIAQQAALLAQRQQDQSLLERDRQQRALLEAQHHQAQSGQQHQEQSDRQQQSQDTRHGSDQVDGAVKLATPEVWTRPDRADFIGQMKQDPEAIIVLGHGETVTVKAVTNPAGSRMFWEFATENYDLAFGVSFQWPGVDGAEGQVVEVLPSERKQSHELVIGGSHSYPGSGTYLIQFDNTYSVLRAKTVYYRVYYAA